MAKSKRWTGKFLTSQSLYFQIVVNPGLPAQNVTIYNNLIDGYQDHGDDGETPGNAFIEGNPRFFNASGASFYLQVTSPAIDAGSAQDAPNTDFDGRVRPWDENDNGATLYDTGYKTWIFP